jgi:hypothetical protein
MNDYLGTRVTASASSIMVGLCQVSDKEKVEQWFIEPLCAMKDDQAFICLTVCFPLLETILRYELNIPDNENVSFSDGSKALKWFAKFMTIPEVASHEIWDAFRNGLLHRAMIKGTLPYDLTGRAVVGRPAELKDGRVVIHVWDLRDKLVNKLRKHHRKLWRAGGSELPNIYIRA